MIGRARSRRERQRMISRGGGRWHPMTVRAILQRTEAST